MGVSLFRVSAKAPYVLKLTNSPAFLPRAPTWLIGLRGSCKGLQGRLGLSVLGPSVLASPSRFRNLEYGMGMMTAWSLPAFCCNGMRFMMLQITGL